MNQIARCDWLPERARWSHLARSGLPAVSRKQNFTKSHIINPLLTKFVRSRWLNIGLVLFLRVYWSRLNTQKKNLANIQPSWPHTWSITHTYWLIKIFTWRKRRYRWKRAKITALLNATYDRENNDCMNALRPRRFKWSDFSTDFIWYWSICLTLSTCQAFTQVLL